MVREKERHRNREPLYPSAFAKFDPSAAKKFFPEFHQSPNLETDHLGRSVLNGIEWKFENVFWLRNWLGEFARFRFLPPPPRWSGVFPLFPCFLALSSGAGGLQHRWVVEAHKWFLVKSCWLLQRIWEEYLIHYPLARSPSPYITSYFLTHTHLSPSLTLFLYLFLFPFSLTTDPINNPKNGAKQREREWAKLPAFPARRKGAYRIYFNRRGIPAGWEREG